ncbi:MAG: trigger factor [Salinivirgaceae bacterium]|nr:trigger factor [Salinivirgaceae bacterium]MBR5167845.1 trigger factor [Salinivirgaceae bacterium]
MNISRENIDELNVVVTVKVDKTDYAETVEKSIKDYRKKVNLNGFRPGNAPLGLVKKMYGKAILWDELNRIVSKNLMEYIKNEKIDFLGEPLPSTSQKADIDLDNKEEFTFTFDLGLKPAIDLKLSKKDKLPFYNITVSDEMINSAIESNSYRFGKTVEADNVEEKDLVKGTFEQLAEDGNVLEGGIKTEDALFAVDRINEESIRALVIGAKKGDIIDFDITKAFTNNTDRAQMLRITAAQSESLTGNFRLTLTSISRHQPAETNQELFDIIYGKGVVNSIDEYKAKIKEEFQKELAIQSNFKFIIDAKDKLIDKTDMKLPDEFLKRWIVVANEKTTAEDVEKSYPEMRKEFAWQLIKGKIATDNNIVISDNDLLDAAKEQISSQFRQYGLSTLPDEQLTEFAKQSLSKEDERQHLHDRKLDEKIAAWLKETVKVDEKDVTTQEFNNLFK